MGVRLLMVSHWRRRGFSLIEVLMVLMLISTAILPIYSLIKSSQKRIVRADEKTLATLFGASALELARTLGFEKAQNLEREKEFQELVDSARKNGFDLKFEQNMVPVGALPGTLKQVFLLRIKITISSIGRAITDSPTLTFYSILSDPRFTFY